MLGSFCGGKCESSVAQLDRLFRHKRRTCCLAVKGQITGVSVVDGGDFVTWKSEAWGASADGTFFARAKQCLLAVSGQTWCFTGAVFAFSASSDSSPGAFCSSGWLDDLRSRMAR